MALGTGVTGSGFVSSTASSIATSAFTPTAGSRLVGVVVWLPETNAVPSTVTDGEGLGNTYALDGSPVTGADGRKSQRFYSTNNISISGSMVLTVAFAGAATNNVDAGHVVVQEVTDTGGPELAGSGTGGQAQAVAVVAANNASTGACGTPSANGGLVVGIFTHAVEFDTHSAGTGYTFVAEDTNPGRSWYVEKLQQTTAAAVTATMSVNQTGNMHNHAFTMKAPVTGYTLTCTQQSYTLTGNATGLATQRLLTATQQSYTLTGNATTLTYTPSGARTLTCDSQSYTLTGFDVALAPQSPPAYYTLTGNDVALLASTRIMVCDQQSYTLTGNATGFLTARVMPCVQASYTLLGPSTNLIYSNAPTNVGGLGADSVRGRTRPYTAVKRRHAAIVRRGSR